MTDIIIRTSDGRVQVVADTIVLVGDRYLSTVGSTVSHEPVNSFGFPVTLVKGVAGVPADLNGGWNYNYVNNAFVSSGVAAPVQPTPPAPSIWSNKPPLKRAKFLDVVRKAIGNVSYNRIKADPNGGPIFDEIMSSDPIDPNASDGLFVANIATLLTTAGADNQGMLLTNAQLVAINSGWN